VNDAQKLALAEASLRRAADEVDSAETWAGTTSVTPLTKEAYAVVFDARRDVIRRLRTAQARLAELRDEAGEAPVVKGAGGRHVR
jgi:hypothetical protein